MKVTFPIYRRKARIEIIPLIDVVFFLLATFIVLSLSMVPNRGIEVQLPAAATGSVQDRNSTIVITVTKTGEIYLNKVKVNSTLLEKRLEQLKTGYPKIEAVVNADQRAEFGSAINVLDLLRKIGISKVSVNTRDKSN